MKKATVESLHHACPQLVTAGVQRSFLPSSYASMMPTPLRSTCGIYAKVQRCTIKLAQRGGSERHTWYMTNGRCYSRLHFLLLATKLAMRNSACLPEFVVVPCTAFLLLVVKLHMECLADNGNCRISNHELKLIYTTSTYGAYPSVKRWAIYVLLYDQCTFWKRRGPQKDLPAVHARNDV